MPCLSRVGRAAAAASLAVVLHGCGCDEKEIPDKVPDKVDTAVCKLTKLDFVIPDPKGKVTAKVGFDGKPFEDQDCCSAMTTVSDVLKDDLMKGKKPDQAELARLAAMIAPCAKYQETTTSVSMYVDSTFAEAAAEVPKTNACDVPFRFPDVLGPSWSHTGGIKLQGFDDQACSALATMSSLSEDDPAYGKAEKVLQDHIPKAFSMKVQLTLEKKLDSDSDAKLAAVLPMLFDAHARPAVKGLQELLPRVVMARPAAAATFVV